MKKILALTVAALLVLALCAGCGSSAAEEAAPAEDAAAAGETYTATFSTGETYAFPAGEDLAFFFQCDSPGDMGAPADGEEGAGITASEGTVTYSDVGLGGPNSYPTSEKVTVSGITGDVTITVTDAATAMDATHTIYFDADEIQAAIDYANQMAAEQAANPMGGSGETSDEASDEASGEASGEVPATDGTENQNNTLAADVEPATEEEFNSYKDYLIDYMNNYTGEGDGTGFDESAMTMALGELDNVSFGADVYAFPFEMFVSQFGAMTFADFIAQ